MGLFDWCGVCREVVFGVFDRFCWSVGSQSMREGRATMRDVCK